LSAGLPRLISVHAPSCCATASRPWPGSGTSPGNQQPKVFAQVLRNRLAPVGGRNIRLLTRVQVCVLEPAGEPSDPDGEGLEAGQRPGQSRRQSPMDNWYSERFPIWDVLSGRHMRPRTPLRPAFVLVIGLVEPPAGIEPATPSLPWNHQEPLCGPPFPQLAPDRRGQSYRFSCGEVMRSLFTP
jgi:hypothetical protein